MEINLKNCNNIENGTVSLKENTLNIKYAINGTGKSTIASAISAAIKKDMARLKELTPFQFLKAAENHKPEVTGVETFSNLSIFNEAYVSQFVFQSTEIVKNSFEIFVKTTDYDKHLDDIKNLLIDINKSFHDNPELETLIQTLSQLLAGHGNSKNSFASNSIIGKGIAKGNITKNLPTDLERYAPYVKNTENGMNAKWIGWQHEGKPFLSMADQCPYCTASVETTKETILKVSEVFDSKTVDNINKMLVIFANLLPFFSDETKSKINEITNNSCEMTLSQKNYIEEIKQQTIKLVDHLKSIQHIGFNSFTEVKKIEEELKKYILDLSLYHHFNSDLTQSKISLINTSLKTVIEKTNKLQEAVGKQKSLIKRTIEDNKREINNFLRSAGYKYEVDIEPQPSDQYRMILKHESNILVDKIRDQLSFGEKNALALLLFMYSTLKENPDLIILDDPISSFDGNKKFAIINMLFFSKSSLKNKTVLLLTHEFSTVIDIIHTFNNKINATASFLSTNGGVLIEKPIEKQNIQSFTQIASSNIKKDIDNLNKLIYLRRKYELEDDKGLERNLLSSLFHKREKPTKKNYNEEEREMSVDEMNQASTNIQKDINDFDYTKEYEKTQDQDTLIKIYNASKSNYEKLQIYRIIFNDNHDNNVIRKYINEIFHIENDYLFQLNPSLYDTVPQFIIDECDRDILAKGT